MTVYVAVLESPAGTREITVEARGHRAAFEVARALCGTDEFVRGIMPREGDDMTAVKGYNDGVEYGRTVAARMSPARRADNDAYVRHAVWALRGSPTRAFWLGFRRAMRGTA